MEEEKKFLLPENATQSCMIVICCILVRGEQRGIVVY